MNFLSSTLWKNKDLAICIFLLKLNSLFAEFFSHGILKNSLNQRAPWIKQRVLYRKLLQYFCLESNRGFCTEVTSIFLFWIKQGVLYRNYFNIFVLNETGVLYRSYFNVFVLRWDVPNSIKNHFYENKKQI